MYPVVIVSGRAEVNLPGQPVAEALEQGDLLHREVHRGKFSPPELQRCPR